jgi:copper chaperone CopZ
MLQDVEKEFTGLESSVTTAYDKAKAEVEVEPKEKKVTGYSKRLEKEMVKAGIIKDMEDKAEYSGIKHADQAEKAIKLVEEDYDLAKQIAYGEKQASGDLRNISVYNAVKARAKLENDVETIRNLGMSGVHRELSEAAQTLGLAEDRDLTDPVEAIDSVVKVREKTAEKTIKNIKKAKKEEVSKIKENVKKFSPTKEAWADFIKSLQC